LANILLFVESSLLSAGTTSSASTNTAAVSNHKWNASTKTRNVEIQDDVQVDFVSTLESESASVQSEGPALEIYKSIAYYEVQVLDMRYGTTCGHFGDD
jgi:hypothetical protein